MTEAPEHLPEEMKKKLFASTHKGMNFTNITKQDLFRYFKEWRISRRLYIMTLSEEDYTMDHKLELQELERLHDMMTHNAVDGVLSRMATTDTKNLRVEGTQQKRGWLSRGGD